MSYSFSQRSGTAARTDGLSSLMSRPTVLSDSTNSDSQPTYSGPQKLTVKLNAWKSGSTVRNESFSPMSAWNALYAPSMSVTKLLCVSIAPFGLPVVPEV